MTYIRCASISEHMKNKSVELKHCQVSAAHREQWLCVLLGATVHSASRSVDDFIGANDFVLGNGTSSGLNNCSVGADALCVIVRHKQFGAAETLGSVVICKQLIGWEVLYCVEG
jgi:hypothetical protein